ncbi:HNH endonuclease [Eubacteriaceae bacterium ES2]|nr:HNH endonuclease [Eubacteriaceae bacterium ES2]
MKVERDGKCNRCGTRPKHFSSLIGHHIEELTENNVDDANISLNPENIEIICQQCHNREHRRFGNKRTVYIVYGSPFAGKETMVREMMRKGDIVLDIDSLWQAVTYEEDKPNGIRFNVFKMRDCLYDQIRTRYGKWIDAYVIGGYPDKYERERVAKELNAEIIYCESTKEECLERFYKSGKPEVWKDYIDTWWEKFSA